MSRNDGTPDEETVQPLAVQFGRRLRAVRETTGISQERLAHICGLDRTYIGVIERGKKNPSLVTIVRIATGLQVDPAELVRGLAYEEGSAV
jgi:transcriptional regulator with XRE-family HTH domain